MPENVLYWWGYYDSDNLEDNGMSVDYSGTFTPISVTHNTNNLSLNVSAQSYLAIDVNTINPISGTVKFLADSTTQYNGYGVNASKEMGNEIIESGLSSTTTLYSTTASNQYFYFGYWSVSSRSITQNLYALWYE